MCSRFRSRTFPALIAAAAMLPAFAEPPRMLRVCADPNNLPFSNERGEGLENRLAELVAEDLDARVEYFWWAQRRGFVRNTLGAGECDVIMGVPRELDSVLTTQPYYRSTYAFVSRTFDHANYSPFDDPALRAARIGVHLIGDDFANTPPAHALGRRGIVTNVIGYTIYGDYNEANPPARIIDAVARGDIDVAIVWGPLAGYFASRAAVPLTVIPVADRGDAGVLPFTFAISLGVKRGNEPLRDELEHVLARERTSIAALLDEYGVPRLEDPALASKWVAPPAADK
jgi:mxaJ protein